MDDDQLPRQSKPEPRNLETLSVDDLEAYIGELEAEIARVRDHLARKRAYLAGAGSLFRT